jgi:hypothetical protein
MYVSELITSLNYKHLFVLVDPEDLNPEPNLYYRYRYENRGKEVKRKCETLTVEKV